MKTPAPTRIRRTDLRSEKARLHCLNIYLSDPSLKERLGAVAKKEGMSKSGWIRHHIMPEVEKYIEERLAKLDPPGFKVPPPPRSIFETMKDAALANIKGR
jgi:hypothetical protein